jgi:hypothetical protein
MRSRAGSGIRLAAVVLAGLAFGCVLVGCSGRAGEPVPVKGVLKIKGKETPGVLVTFHPSKGKAPPGAMTDVEGQFTLKIPPGNYKVTLLPLPGMGRKGAPVEKDGGGGHPVGVSGPPVEASIPADCKDAAKTPLQVDVGSNGNEHVVLDVSAGEAAPPP